MIQCCYMGRPKNPAYIAAKLKNNEAIVCLSSRIFSYHRNGKNQSRENDQ